MRSGLTSRLKRFLSMPKKYGASRSLISRGRRAWPAQFAACQGACALEASEAERRGCVASLRSRVSIEPVSGRLAPMLRSDCKFEVSEVTFSLMTAQSGCSDVAESNGRGRLPLCKSAGEPRLYFVLNPSHRVGGDSNTHGEATLRL